MKSDAVRYRREIYNCMLCKRFGFTAPAAQKPFFKFPPTIGAIDEAPILFVGINPRRSSTNLDLHDSLMADVNVFHDLARNRYRGRRYIAFPGGQEVHYNNHARIAGAIFPGRHFEEVAAVTELFLCAKENSSGLPVIESPCAEQFFDRTIRQVRPSVVIPVGKQALGYFQSRFHQTAELFAFAIGDCCARVVPMSHPAARPKDVVWTIEWTLKNARRALSGLPAATRNEPQAMPAMPTGFGGQARAGSSSDLDLSEPAVTYTFSRLCFKADKIEPLSPASQFRVITPVGTFQMSKADFYRDFPRVVISKSYVRDRIYHFPKVPSVALRYRV